MNTIIPLVKETIQEKLARLKAGMVVNKDSNKVLQEVQKAVISSIPPVPAPTPIVRQHVLHQHQDKPASNLTPIQLKLRALLDAKKAGLLHPLTPSTVVEITNGITHAVTTFLNTLESNTTLTGIDKVGNVISYNSQQLDFIQTASQGIDCILIGAAGTGKTTCMRGAVSSLIQSGIVPPAASMEGHKYLPAITQGIVLVSFTRRAVSNLRKAMSEDLKSNCLTIHALLEYEPVYHDVMDTETGETRTAMRFEPTRHATNPLPPGIKTCVIDESSMVSTDLFAELKAALPSNCQFIFLGDIQQLPPVFGAAILGYKMLELKTVELIEVYRQALESPIIRLAHRILSGKPIPLSEYADWKFKDQLTIHPWKKKLDSEIATMTMAKFLTVAIDNKLYDPLEDMILMPFNKACGTIEINKHIANHIARASKLMTYEVIAGFNKLYLTIGDRVLCDKEDAIITGIKLNPTYTGMLPQPASPNLDYWGCEQIDGVVVEHEIELDNEGEIDLLLSMAAGTDDEDRVRKASHIVTVKLLDTDREIELSSAAALNGMLLSYALTVHKSQGSEFRKVFLMLHQSHNTMLQRELLYTAVTRAREELYVICEPESFTKGITSQRIRGNTLAEKAEYFKGKVIANNKDTIL
jgi:exodeoxyribonuclease V alpha subunit